MAIKKFSINRINSELQLYPFYSEKKFFQKNRGCQEGTPFIKTQLNRIPNFNIALESATTFELRIIDDTETTVQTFNDATLQGYVQTETDTSKDYLNVSRLFNENEVTLSEGIYRLELDADSETYYGEWFQVLKALSNITCETHIELQWWVDCLHYEDEMYAADNGYRDEIVIPYSDMQIQTSYEFEEEGVENGEGEFTPIYKRQVKRYKLKFPVPYSSVGAFSFMQLSTDAYYQDNLSNTFYGIKNIEINLPDNFDEVCFQLCEITFELGVDRGRSVYNSGKCCDVDIYTGTVLEDIVNNECETFVREGCDFEVDITANTGAGTGGSGVAIVITANVYDKGTTDTYTPSGTLVYTWKRVKNGDCDCETLADTDEDVIIRDDGASPPFDRKGKYICIVEDDGTGCRMSDQYNYQNNCRSGDTIYTPDNPDCDAFDTTLTYDATNKQLTSTAESVPSGETASYAWYYTDNNGNTTKLSDTSQTIGLSTNYGEYTSVVTAGDCQVRKTYTHTDECQNFTFTKTIDGDSITYTPPSGYSPTYSWDYIDTDGTRSSLATTTATHVAQNTGYYELTATDGDCEYINQTYMVIDDCTGKSVEITASGNTLTATPTGFSGSETYAWFLDTGSGASSLSATGATYEATQTGNYIVEVTESSCTASDNRVMIITAECCDLTASIAQEGALLICSVAGCDTDEEIRWFYWNGSNFVYVDIGTTHTPSNFGIYKAEVTCGDCDIVETFFDYND